MLTLSIAGLSLLIGVLTGVFATVAGLVVVILLAAAVVAAACVAAGLGPGTIAVQVVVSVVAVQLGYALQALVAGERAGSAGLARALRTRLQDALRPGGGRRPRKGDNPGE